MIARCLLALGLAAAVVSQGVAQDTPAPAFTLVPTTLMLAPGQTSMVFNVVVLAKGLTPDKTKPLTPILMDQAAAAIPGVDVKATFISTSDVKAAEQRWSFRVEVSKFPLADSQTRIFLLEYGNVHHSLTYTLTNLAGKTFAWWVKIPTEWNAESMKSLGVAIKVGDLPATGVALGAINLVEEKRKVTLGTEHLELCSSASGGACNLVPVLEARTPVTLHLRAKNLPVGKFKGSIAITAREKTDTDSLDLTIYSPRSGWQWYGFRALAAGTLLSLVLHAILRPLFQRLRESQVVLRLQQSVEDMKKEVTTFPKQMVEACAPWFSDANRLLEDIAAIPLRSPVAMPFDDEVAGLASFKSAIEACTPALLHLRLRFRSGLVEVHKLFVKHQSKPGALDAAAETAALISIEPAASDAAAKINAHVDALRSKLKVAVLSAAPRATTAEDLATISFQLVAASVAVWLFWGLISVATGMLLLVYSNPAFGTPVDWWTCFLWALGVSVVGQQASQLTPTHIATNVGIKFPGGKNA